jgi:hypothetical protein
MTSLSKKRRAIIAIEDEGALAWQDRAALRRVLEPENAPLQRMHLFEPDRGREIDQHLDEVC